MKRTAVFWIRDGVLVDRMSVNAVAFAVATLAHANQSASSNTSLTELVNFAFATSGISAADKMSKLNSTQPTVDDVAAAAAYYNKLAGESATQCRYFPGACGLLKQLRELGALNFITSAVEQPVLDAWAESQQGKLSSAHLTEILGARDEGFKKGRAHFAYVFEHYGVERIFYVADATAEISTGAQCQQDFNISPIGFAHVITAEKVRQAHQLVIDAHSRLAESSLRGPGQNLVLDETGLSLPGSDGLHEALQNAGASYVVSGDASQIMSRLAAYLNGVLI